MTARLRHDGIGRETSRNVFVQYLFIFLALVFLAGYIAELYLGHEYVQASKSWQKTTCFITRIEMQRSFGKQGNCLLDYNYTTSSGQHYVGHDFDVMTKFRIPGFLGIPKESCRDLNVGDVRNCYYDPKRPKLSVLNLKTHQGFYLASLVFYYFGFWFSLHSAKLFSGREKRWRLGEAFCTILAIATTIFSTYLFVLSKYTNLWFLMTAVLFIFPAAAFIYRSIKLTFKEEYETIIN